MGQRRENVRSPGRAFMIEQCGEAPDWPSCGDVLLFFGPAYPVAECLVDHRFTASSEKLTPDRLAMLADRRNLSQHHRLAIEDLRRGGDADRTARRRNGAATEL
jgi:hypothetical protein